MGVDRKTLALLLSLAAPVGTGCVRKPYEPLRCDRPDLSGCVIDSVDVIGSRGVSAGAIKEKIATAETSHVLGGALEHVPLLSLWDRLIIEYERLDPFVLERDLARIERLYRAQGYYEAHVQAGRVIRLPGGKVKVEIVVDEGEPVKIAKVNLTWKDWSLPLAARVTGPATNTSTATLKVGAIFEEDPFEETKKAIKRVLTDRGFAYAEVEGKVSVDLLKHEASVVYTVELGPHATFGDISIEGQGELPTTPLYASIQIKKGAEYSTAALDAAEAALGDFGVFGSIEIVAKSSKPDPVIPVVFRVTPAALRAIRLGGGAEVGGRVGVHGLVGWENRNLFGGLRRFLVELRPGIVFHPKTFETLFDDTSVLVLPEVKTRFTLTQPALLGTLDPRLRGILSGSYSLSQLATAEAQDTAVVIGYAEAAGSVGVERPFWSSHVTAGLSFNVQYDIPFTYKGELPDGYGSIFIPYVQSTATLDFRRSQGRKIDPVNPHSGFYLANDLQFAFASARDVRIRPEFRGYVPISKKITLGTRFVLGLLFPFNYGDPALEGEADICRDLQLSQFRAFFSGGANSNRGYSYNGVGRHQLTCLSDPRHPNTDVAIGGFRLWESSIELRFPVVGKLGSVIFADAGDVTRGAFRICAPHLSTGLGLRYETPVGPFRADVGYRIPGAQVFSNHTPCVPADEGNVQTIFGAPIAVSVAIGEAF